MRAAELGTLLPAVFRDALDSDVVLARFLQVMEEIHAPVEALLANLDAVFNPHRSPDRFVAMLARWVDLERIDAASSNSSVHIEDDIPTGRMRELIARSFALSQMRGTRRGLIEFLEIATGVTGFSIEEPTTGTAAQAFHLRITVPAQAAPQMRLIERIVTSEKPAYATWEPVVAQTTSSPQ